MNRRTAMVAAAVLVAGFLAWFLLRGGDSGAPSVTPDAAAADAGSDAPSGAGAQARLKAMRERAGQPDAGAEAPSAPGVIATFGWGNGPGNLGRNRPTEGNPEAPMSLTRDRFGNTWVLDQVNGRLVKLDKNGKEAGDVKLPLQGPQDLAITKDGTAAVLDRVVDSAVALIGPDGKQVGELKVEGKGIEEGGGVTGVFTDGDDIYVEREYGDLVKLGDSKGKADTDRPEVPGRPTRDGLSYISATIANQEGGTAAVTSIDRASRQHRYTREVPLGAPIIQLMLLDTDLSGVIYLAGLVEMPSTTQSGEGTPLISILCLDPLDGRPIGRAQLPANMNADETWRELTVLDEGGVLFLHRTEQRSELMRADCR